MSNEQHGNLRLSLEDEPSEDELKIFFDILRSYNREHGGASNYKPLSIFLRDANDKILGGLTGETGWNWLWVENLAVDETLRKQGIGSQLLEAAEKEAIARGCTKAHLDTFSFQALPFYEKHGYSVYGVLDDFPPGFKRYYLRKTLT